MQRVLIIGGCGRIGRNIAQDILSHTEAEVTVTGRQAAGLAIAKHLGSRARFQVLELANRAQWQAAVAEANLVIHAAGPFYYQNGEVLASCIEQGVNYLDVSDERNFTRKVLTHHEAAAAAGVTAIINTGVFPGISNSMVRQGMEALDQAESIQLSYIVAGSGGAGVTVMRTTFIGLQHPFEAWLGGQWQTIKPYTQRETLAFPAPYGRAAVYWYDMPEALTLQQSFSVQNVITKFGVVPDFYNYATWAMAHGLPTRLLRNSRTVEFLAQVSYRMTDVTDRFSGTGVAIRCDIQGQQSGQTVHYVSTFSHPSAAQATGLGTGSLAELLLTGQLHQPGVYPVERVLPTALFQATLKSRQLQIAEAVQPVKAPSGK
jgi:saccharopine dehydrogenase-like NADP-dependent oxidoreductase